MVPENTFEKAGEVYIWHIFLTRHIFNEEQERSSTLNAHIIVGMSLFQNAGTGMNVSQS